MPRFEFIMIMRRAEVRLTTLERPAFLLRPPLLSLCASVLTLFALPPSPPRSSFFRFLVHWFKMFRSSPYCKRTAWEHRRISFLAILLFPILLSSHRFVSIHSLFVHSASSALIAEVKWDSGKRSRGCAPTPELLFQWTLARLHSAVSLSTGGRRKKFQVLRRCVSGGKKLGSKTAAAGS